MANKPKKPEVQDEPGAEDRFLRGVKKALETPPKPYTPPTQKAKKGFGSKGAKDVKRG